MKPPVLSWDAQLYTTEADFLRSLKNSCWPLQIVCSLPYITPYCVQVQPTPMRLWSHLLTNAESLLCPCIAIAELWILIRLRGSLLVLALLLQKIRVRTQTIPINASSVYVSIVHQFRFRFVPECSWLFSIPFFFYNFYEKLPVIQLKHTSIHNSWDRWDRGIYGIWKPEGRGCSARAQRGRYLRARRFLNRVDPVGRSV